MPAEFSGLGHLGQDRMLIAVTILSKPFFLDWISFMKKLT